MASPNCMHQHAHWSGSWSLQLQWLLLFQLWMVLCQFDFMTFLAWSVGWQKILADHLTGSTGMFSLWFFSFISIFTISSWSALLSLLSSALNLFSLMLLQLMSLGTVWIGFGQSWCWQADWGILHLDQPYLLIIIYALWHCCQLLLHHFHSCQLCLQYNPHLQSKWNHIKLVLFLIIGIGHAYLGLQVLQLHE